MYLSHDIEIVLKEKALLDKQVHVHSVFFLDSIKYSPPPQKKKVVFFSGNTAWHYKGKVISYLIFVYKGKRIYLPHTQTVFWRNSVASSLFETDWSVDGSHICDFVPFRFKSWTYDLANIFTTCTKTSSSRCFRTEFQCNYATANVK